MNAGVVDADGDDAYDDDDAVDVDDAGDVDADADYLQRNVSAKVWRPVMWRASLNILRHHPPHLFIFHSHRTLFEEINYT